MRSLTFDPFPGWKQRIGEDKLSPEYRLIESANILKNGQPFEGAGQLRRVQWSLFRQVDEKLLARGVYYGRSDGNFIVLGHPHPNRALQILRKPLP